MEKDKIERIDYKIQKQSSMVDRVKSFEQDLLVHKENTERALRGLISLRKDIQDMVREDKELRKDIQRDNARRE